MLGLSVNQIYSTCFSGLAAGNWGLFSRVLMESGAFAQWNTMTMAQASSREGLLTMA